MPAAKCPICQKPATEKYKPFCSKRCSDIDLGRWLKGSYAIPGKAPGEGEEEDEEVLPFLDIDADEDKANK
jgi:endogenous inhibitor of DNA gyrase (YacG/DUF329 family)